MEVESYEDYEYYKKRKRQINNELVREKNKSENFPKALEEVRNKKMAYEKIRKAKIKKKAIKSFLEKKLSYKSAKKLKRARIVLSSGAQPEKYKSIYFKR